MKYSFICKLKWVRIEFYADGIGHAHDIMRALGMNPADWEGSADNPA